MAFRPHRDALGAASPGVAQALGVGSVLRGKKTSLRHEEAIGRKAQGGVMMKAAPTASFIMIEPEFLLEVLIIPLDPPAQFGRVNQIDCCATIKTGHPATICHTSDGGAVSGGQADVKPEAASGGSPKGQALQKFACQTS